ncbi:8-oxo-dGTP diphosphatase [Ancylomarina subtilis]|uniref:8-oxo-dGTP diphosphatase n=1 Tax=Ancylomarina subtilis TaxID=1639035 RepID=A0A4Q7VIQ3_9BACT|nr:NUDIX hydrolase [Ancylomarina subtilis]RZT96040.1 8-oxo-dGTP diphosphatase [Ancylomarina subtilis]
MESKRPKVGVGVAVIKEGRVLLGKRKNAHGDGTWAFPGGHLEYQECWEDCAIREILEETGLRIKNVRYGTVTNDIFQEEQKHYVTIVMLADYDFGDVNLMEPDKCERWEWFDWNNLPQSIFMTIQNLKRNNYNPITSSKIKD